ncbi:tetratricopeptide repeat protein [Rhodospirillum rubrum]|uniref:Tetratricopeptide TPR_2 n=1 Tax=Rhodospirillum rubrum (strain ATCC 11170 / ATH 1.1.1 / DSM 467 / LMG 4362 / NCIMB 8255 / S1) TaxID=269796 RepID=Q2RRU8_RHORT|nr:hypothetical protein [Rhodospirillum rubrum]ABC23147.1 hypothetical protein Rru_A2347 [Rhodospirillum rubrum ATCC 11170]AEO48879.1 hypothetical protein F11_12075 [Rhodospirillum rubrum F11]MBK5954780.1 hypothetical protein [Rhodospirillum rubrum]QXG79130.1 hypothetical protein KUL73_12115 [Rhodospirillum rubrum]HAQ00123.1 hypothetical protein [Rhodospirillum rubrum]
MPRLRLMSSALVGGLFLGVAPVLAQEAPRANIDAQIDQAFGAVLGNPANLQIGRTYAGLLVEGGNFEGAIAALERLLLDPAADPSIRVELGILYYRVGSYGMAESYLTTALADPRVSGQVRDDAEKLLRDVKRRNAPGGKLSGAVSIGLRGQTNPTAASSAGSLSYGGTRVAIPEQSRRNGDFDVFLNAGANHEWDLETQNSATVVTTGALFANHYGNAEGYDSDSVKNDPQDLVALNATTGIRFKPSPADVPDLTLRPYIGASELLLSGNQYMASAGGGLDIAYAFNGGATLVGATYDIRRTFFEERADISESGGQSGYEQYLQLNAVQEVAPLNIVSLNLTLRDHNADRPYFDYQGVEARVSYGLSYRNPLGWDEGFWTSSVYGGPVWRAYQGPDPVVDPARTRKDVEWRVGASQAVPITQAVSFLLGVEYTTTDSNLPNYSYNNFMASSSFVFNF